ncbi:MAG: hypothetical protein ABGW76_02205 [Mesonia sp.]|uniref:hypothetical protein n=1 Tax=Mesonia sp. TaxID=1960830 RepID=UPI0032428C1F
MDNYIYLYICAVTPLNFNIKYVMKKRYFLFILVLICIHSLAHAQVGVNTTDPQAALDIRATNPTSPSNSDGLLIPRISAFPSTDPTASQNGMIVYLTTTVGTNGPGFYYWDNSQSDWLGLGTGSSNNAWSLSGNAGTDSDNDYIGTTDNEALVFGTNNTPRLRITATGRLETLNAGRSVFLGRFAGQNDDLTDNDNVFIGYSAGQLNTSGVKNIAIGINSLQSNTSGAYNVAVGDGSMRYNISAIRNSAFGENSLLNLTTGSFNSAYGSRSLMYNQEGTFNTAFGVQSLRDNLLSYNTAFGGRSFWNNQSGTNNVGVGYRVFANNITGSGNIGIGFQAGLNETGSNKLYIENSNSPSPLIGGDFSQNQVSINMNLSTTTLEHTLTVGGDVYASEGFETPTDTYPDYVFENYYNGASEILPSYSFKSLAEVEEFIKTNGHLPGVKSYEEVKAKDFKIELGATSITNLEKIEESFLYIIELNKKLKLQEEELQEKDQKIEELEERLEKIEKLLLK